MSHANLPKRVTIELSNRCNRLCSGCPRHKMSYPQGDMSPELFLSVVEQLPASRTVVPFFRGESLLHPHFAELMPKLQKFASVQLASNGDLLTKQNQAAILSSCSFFSVSLHSLLMPWHTKHPSFLYALSGRGVETQVSILETLVPEKRKKRFIREWRKHADRVRLYKKHSERGFGSMKGESASSPCSKPFEELVVYWDGRVGLCNHDWNNGVDLGSVADAPVEDIWRNEVYQEVRRFHAGGNRRLVPACRDCCFDSNKTYGELVRNG